MNRGAFFDLDETLYRGKSLLEFALSIGLLNSLADFTKSVQNTSPKDFRLEANKAYYRLWEGRTVQEMQQLSYQWTSEKSDSQNAFNQPVVSRLIAHEQADCKIVVVTGSPESIARPLLSTLPVNDILCPLQEVENGIYTGRLLEQCIGHFKAQRIERYALTQEIDLTDSFAYGDDLSDVPMLKTVGIPTVVGFPGSPAVEFAQKCNWEILG